MIVEKPCETCNKPCSSCETPCESCNSPCESCNKPCSCEKPCRSCDKPCKCDRPPCNHCEKPCCEKPCRSCNKPCKCDRPPCKHCEKPCCEKPSCSTCIVESVAVITTVEIIENCPSNEEIIYNDEPQIIETNYTITSTYNISAAELAQQQIETEQFLKDQQEARKGICGGGGFGFGFHGIKHDEEYVPNNITSLDDPLEFSNSTKGHLIAEIANNHNNKPTKPCQITSGWSCRKIGRYPHPTNCQKVNVIFFLRIVILFLINFFLNIYFQYIQCHFCGDNTVYQCPYEQSYDGQQCSSDWSTCPQIRNCQYDRELLPDPWNKSNYFICVRKKGTFRKFFIFRRFCQEDYEFDPVRQQCYPTKIVVIIKPQQPCHHGCNTPCHHNCNTHNSSPCHHGCNTHNG